MFEQTQPQRDHKFNTEKNNNEYKKNFHIVSFKSYAEILKNITRALLSQAKNEELNFKAVPPISLLLVGLQGSGKTTSAAKLAKNIEKNNKKKVMLVSLDVYRPAAQEQLKLLAEANGIQCLHQMGIVHRDIKPSNIIVNKNKVKIIDFGSSASVTLGTLRKINKKEGYTKQYHPPLFNDDDIDDNNQLFSIGSFYDIWSIMIICTEMVHKRPSEFYTILDPELKENFEDAFGYYLTSQEIKDNKFKENFNKLLGDLMYSKTLKKKWEQLFDYDYSVQCDVSSLDNGILIPLKNLPWYCRIISDLKKDDLILETVAHKIKMKDIAHY